MSITHEILGEDDCCRCRDLEKENERLRVALGDVISIDPCKGCGLCKPDCKYGCVKIEIANKKYGAVK